MFRKKRGFTLVELLVVMAIVGLLAGLLTTAIASSRESARKAYCANNLRQVYISLVMYAADHDGKLPDVSTEAAAHIIEYAADKTIWQKIAYSAITPVFASDEEEDMADTTPLQPISTPGTMVSIDPSAGSDSPLPSPGNTPQALATILYPTYTDESIFYCPNRSSTDAAPSYNYYKEKKGVVLDRVETQHEKALVWDKEAFHKYPSGVNVLLCSGKVKFVPTAEFTDYYPW